MIYMESLKKKFIEKEIKIVFIRGAGPVWLGGVGDGRGEK